MASNQLQLHVVRNDISQITKDRARPRRPVSVLVGVRLGDTHLAAAVVVSETENATQFFHLPLSRLPDLRSIITARLPKNLRIGATETRFQAVAAIDADADDRQRQDLKQRLTDAGFTVLRIVHAPTAAMVAYGVQKDRSETHTMVLHMGNRSCTCALICSDHGVFERLSAQRVDDFQVYQKMAYRMARQAVSQLVSRVLQGSCVRCAVPAIAQYVADYALALDQDDHGLPFEAATTARIDLPHLDLHLVVPRSELWTAHECQQMADLVQRTLTDTLKPDVIRYAVVSAEHDCFLSEATNSLRTQLPNAIFLYYLPATRVMAMGALEQARVLTGYTDDSDRVL